MGYLYKYQQKSNKGLYRVLSFQSSLVGVRALVLSPYLNTSEHSAHRLFRNQVPGVKGTLQLVRDCKQRTWTIPVFLLQDLTSLSGIAIYFLFTICSVLQMYCYLFIQENNGKALKAPSRVEAPFLETIVVLLLVARSKHHSYPIQPRNLYVLRRR